MAGRRVRMLVAVGAALVAAAPAHAQERVVDLISGGSALIDPQAWSVSADGSATLFTTAERLTAQDTDDSVDAYLRAGGTTTLVSTGERNGNQPFDVSAPALSRDGTHAFFTTSEPLAFADNDTAPDVYESVSGRVRLLSGGPTNSNEPAGLLAVSADGSSVLLATKEALLPDQDTDAAWDVYQRTGDTLTLRTPGTAADVSYAATTADLAKVYIASTEALVSDDTDNGGADIYEASASGYRLISAAAGKPASSSSALSVAAVAEDGSRVVLATNEALLASDADARVDFYSVAAAAQLLSVGPAGGNGDFDAAFYGASRDGRVVAFSTVERLTADDTDANRDIYVSRDGSLELASTGPAGGNAAVDVTGAGPQHVSADGRGVLFVTAEPLVAEDTDTVADLYEHLDGRTRLVSQGELPSSAAVSGTGSYLGAGADDVYFETAQPLTREDVDASNDLYVRSGGATTRLVTPGSAAYDVSLAALPRDGGRVLFLTREQLSADDTDDARDLYSVRFEAAPGPGAAPGPADTTGPALTLAVSRRRFSPKRGTTFVLTTSEPGRINLAFSRLIRGRKGKGGRCVTRPGRRLRHHHRCTRFVQLSGRLALMVRQAGVRRVGFHARLHGHRLARGRYAVFARAYDAAGNASALRSAVFVVR